jgi:hypothetical protein
MTKKSLTTALVGLLGLTILGAPALLAQGVTTGSISGVVSNQDGATTLPGAQISASHVPTGTRYEAITQNDGRFRIIGVRVGGPYTVTASMDGFEPQEQTDLAVPLGEDLFLQFRLPLASITETVDVIASSELINPYRTGNTSSVSAQEIEMLPTIGRRLEDYTRTNPFASVAQTNEDPQVTSVLGRSGRYNNIQIDGAVNNDLFGLADGGTPGGQADVSPISLDAIAEIQVGITPFDVRQGGFSGGAINAVTRSGTNAYHGSVFFFSRDDSLVGDGPDFLGEVGTFEEDQYGFRIGGPIKTDKIFFFANAELTEKSQPTGISLDGSGGQAFANGTLVAQAQLFRQTLIDRYGFDPGGLAQNIRDTPSDKFFGRLDFNLNTSNTLTLRHNFIDAENDINRPGSFSYEFPSETYAFDSETNSTVGQWNSVIGSTMFNELRITNQRIRDRRAPRGGLAFPWIEIENTVPGNRLEFEAGSEPFSTNNELDQDILEITNDFTWLRGNHTFTFGTHNELFSFRNLFIQNGFGSYQFATLDDFVAGRPARAYDFTVVNEGRAPAQEFDVNQLGFYAGDQWRATPQLTLVYGVRVDIPLFPDDPSSNPRTQALYGFRTDELPSGKELISPRIGFNWDIKGDGEQQLRGGVGIFAGRTPYVWISNNYAATGIEQTRLTAFGVPFNPDPFNQPLVGSGTTGEFNLIDPDFEFPQALRYNVGYDRQLPWGGLVGSVELIVSDSLEEIDYKDLNLVQTGTLPFDGRPVFGARVDPTVTAAYLITNTSEGESTNIAVKLERPLRDNVSWFASYTYGDSESVNDGGSSRAVSNYQFNESIDPNNAEVGRSDFEVEHRFNAGATYYADWGGSKWGTSFGVFYNHQSGRPFSYIFGNQPSGSINGDRYFDNDLVYVPATENDVVVEGGATWAQLDAFISSQECLDANRGGIAPRNCGTGPWTHSLDLRVAQDVPIGSWSKLQVTAEIENLANLFDEDAGVVRYINFSTVEPFSIAGVTADGKPRYGLSGFVTNPALDPFTTSSIRSRWRAKLGLRWSF